MMRGSTTALGEKPSVYREPKRWAERARALAASISLFLGKAVVTSEPSRVADACVISLTARLNAASFAADGFTLPLIFRTNCRAAALSSTSVAGGSKLYKTLMFLHMLRTSLVRFRRDALLDRFYSSAPKYLKNSSCERSAPASLRLPEQSNDINALPPMGVV